MKHYLKTGRTKLIPGGGPDIMYFEVDEVLSSKDVEERIKRLSDIRRDLEAAVVAVKALEVDAEAKKKEYGHIKQLLSNLEADKNSVEALLKVPEESFSRLLARANRKSRFRGIIEGFAIGLTTGALSGLLVWYLTK